MTRMAIIAAIVGLAGLALIFATAFTGSGYMLVAGVALMAGFVVWAIVVMVLMVRS